MTNKRLRLAFYKSLFEESPSSPEEDLGLLCKEWLNVMKADWAWLWLADQTAYSTEFQLVAAATKLTNTVVPEILSRETATSVTKYCMRTGEPCHVKDLRTWRKVYDGVEHYVGLVALLEDNGCKEFVSIPIPVPRKRSERSDVGDSVTAVICVHYVASSPPQHEEGTIGLLAGFSGQWIAKSQDAHQRRVLIKLNEIAYRHVARPGQFAEHRRQNYSRDVIALVAEELRVAAVSLFWEDNFREQLHCIASTGLMYGDWKSVVDDLSIVKYLPMVGLTGRCWSTGIASIATHHSSEGSARFVERVIDESGKVVREPATIIYPIKRYTGADEDTAGPKVNGVIRCAAHCSVFFGTKKVKFNAFETETLDFICKQVAPILANVTATIRRERNTHRAAHDIDAAIRLLQAHLSKFDGLEKLDSIEACLAVAKKAFVGVEMSALLLKSASSQLVLPEPAKIGIGETKQLAEILARCVPALQYWAESYGCSLRFTEHYFDKGLSVPEGALERALVNLVDNARRYGRKHGEIILTVGMLDEGVFIDVANSGKGIAFDQSDRVFESGFRGDSDNSHSGEGMGLPSAQRLVRQMGGVLSLARLSNPTVFRISFPPRPE